MAEASAEFVRAARREPYGQVAVFLDIAGNRWDLLGPASDVSGSLEPGGPTDIGFTAHPGGQ